MSTTTHNATASPKPDKHRRPPGGPDATRLYRKMQDLRSGVTTAIDPLGVATPIVHAQMAWLLHPQELGERMAQLLSDLWQLQWHTTHRMLGLEHPDPIQPNADDARFNDPIWSESPNWDMVKDWYLAFTHRAQDMLYDTPGLSSKDRRRAAFWWRKWLNAVAPTNYFWTNPIAIRKAFETRGESLSRGWNNFLEDAQAGTDAETPQFGEPGSVTTPGW